MTRFDRFAREKAEAAAAADVHRLATVEDRSEDWPVTGIGSAWTRAHYDGPFACFEPAEDRPSVSLVFVQSSDRNTGTAQPSSLGGGATDTHLIYEGLSRVAADGVMAGARSAAGADVFFSVWHPEMVALRLALGLPRHPAQVVVSNDGHVDPDRTLLFNVPDVPVFLLAGDRCRGSCARALADRPWVTVLPLGPGGLGPALVQLAAHGLRRLSAIGGRTTASSLIDAGLVQDLCLTTTARPGGTPGTPFYVGRRSPSFQTIVSKRERTVAEPFRFDHLGFAGFEHEARPSTE
jgi:riboflavin biosynthesis pyrimidine reductase